MNNCGRIALQKPGSGHFYFDHFEKIVKKLDQKCPFGQKK